MVLLLGHLGHQGEWQGGNEDSDGVGIFTKLGLEKHREVRQSKEE